MDLAAVYKWGMLRMNAIGIAKNHDHAMNYWVGHTEMGYIFIP